MAPAARLSASLTPSRGSDWTSSLYRESRPRIDAAAVEAGRDPAEIIDVYNFGGRITAEPISVTRDEDGRWVGGSVRQWVDELVPAVVDHGARGFIFRSADGDRATALARLGSGDRPRCARGDRWQGVAARQSQGRQESGGRSRATPWPAPPMNRRVAAVTPFGVGLRLSWQVSSRN